MILIEAADLLLPESPVTQMGDQDHITCTFVRTGFSDPAFANGNDMVVLVLRSPGTNEPTLAAPAYRRSPDCARSKRRHAAGFLTEQSSDSDQAVDNDIVRASAGLNLQAIQRCLLANGGRVDVAAMSEAVEQHVIHELGEGVVELSRPAHSLDDVVGNSQLKTFSRDELIPRLTLGGKAAPTGCAVCGPIGAGKTFIFLRP